MTETKAPYTTNNVSSTIPPGVVAQPNEDDVKFWLLMRQAYLNQVAAIEEKGRIEGWYNKPTTAECRKLAKGR